MAFTPVTPVALNPTIVQGAAQKFNCPVVNDLSGSPVNLSAWVSLTAKLIPPTPVPYGQDTSFGTVAGGASGALSLTVSASDLASIPAGTAKLIITGKPTSGDDAQLLCSGTITVAAG